MKTLIRDALFNTAIFIEGTEQFSSSLPVNMYYGYNVTKSNREPIDQIHGFIAAACIEERNRQFGSTGTFYPFVAGVFEVLNTVNDEQIRNIIEVNTVKEQRKKSLFENIGRHLNLPVNVLLTEDLWGDEDYWTYFLEVIETSGSQFSERSLRKDTLIWYRGREEELNQVNKLRNIAPGLMKIPEKLMKKIGDWPAAILYTPIEVTEALYLHRKKAVSCKIGHMDETVYDKYILPFMDIVHLRQPTDLQSSRLKPIGVTPYIDKDSRPQKLRIYFDDTPDTIRERISTLKFEESVFSWSARTGEVLHPILDKCVLGIEAARLMGKTPVKIDSVSMEVGMDLIRSVYNENIKMQAIVDAFPQFIFDHLIEPFVMN